MDDIANENEHTRKIWLRNATGILAEEESRDGDDEKQKQKEAAEREEKQADATLAEKV